MKFTTLAASLVFGGLVGFAAPFAQAAPLNFNNDYLEQVQVQTQAPSAIEVGFKYKKHRRNYRQNRHHRRHYNQRRSYDYGHNGYRDDRYSRYDSHRAHRRHSQRYNGSFSKGGVTVYF